MNYIRLVLISIMSIFLISCSNLKIGFEEDSIFYDGGLLYIYLDDVNAKDSEYQVYINKEDSEVFLANHFKTRFGITPGQTNIEVRNGSQKVSVDIFLQKSNEYYLKVTKTSQNKIELRQVQESEIDADAKESALYTDDTSEKKTPVTVAPPVAVSAAPEPTTNTREKKVDTEDTESETIITYDKNAGWDF